MKAALSVLKALPMPGRSRCSAICLSWVVRARKGTAIPASGLLTRALMHSSPTARAAPPWPRPQKRAGLRRCIAKRRKKCYNMVRQFVRPGDAVLVKASHSMGLEQLLQEYYKELPQG